MFRLFKRASEVKPVQDPVRVLYDLRKCEIFRDVPEPYVGEMISHMKQIEGHPGDVIIREGEEGDYYYVLLRGRAEVHRRVREGQPPELVAELGDGAGFGEEALISGARRNATVKLKSDSLVLRLPKEPFIDYIEKSLVTWLPPSEALARVEAGARWVDIREPGEGEKDPLPDALTIPLMDLRDRMKDLFREDTYICCCEDGRLSATAAFLMRQQRFAVMAVKGGLKMLRLHLLAADAERRAQEEGGG